MFQIGLKKSLLLLKLKILFRRHVLFVILKTKKLSERLAKKEMKKTKQNELGVEKVIKRKSDNVYVESKGYDLIK